MKQKGQKSLIYVSPKIYFISIWLKEEECIIGTLVLSTINYDVFVAAGRQLLDTKRQLLAVIFLLSTNAMELYFNNSNYIIKHIQQSSPVKRYEFQYIFVKDLLL